MNRQGLNYGASGSNKSSQLLWEYALTDTALIERIGCCHYVYGLWGENYGYWEIIFTLLFFIPAISVSCRRLHDLGKSGWWQLIGITIIGYIPLIYWFCKEGGVASKYASK